jgi:hypothetical protein
MWNFKEKLVVGSRQSGTEIISSPNAKRAL